MELIYGIRILCDDAAYLAASDKEFEYAIDSPDREGVITRIMTVYELDNKWAILGVKVPISKITEKNHFSIEDVLYASLDYELCVRHILESEEHPLKTIFQSTHTPDFWII